MIRKTIQLSPILTKEHRSQSHMAHTAAKVHLSGT
jgi:hypothetical protein